MAIGMTFRKYVERIGLRPTHRTNLPTLIVDNLKLHKQPFKRGPYPDARLALDASGQTVVLCSPEQNCCPEYGQSASPDRGALQPWPPSFEEDR